MKTSLKQLLGVSLLIIPVLLLSCRKDPAAKKDPDPTPLPTVHNPSITVVQQVGIVWDSMPAKFDYVSNDADTVKVNGVIVPNSGTYTVPVAFSSTELTFEVKYGKTIGTSVTKTAAVIPVERSIACGRGTFPKWGVVDCKIRLASNGSWITGQNVCQPTIFMALVDSAKITYSDCQATPDATGPIHFIGTLAGKDLKIFWAQAPGATPKVIEKMTKDTIIRSYYNNGGDYVQETLIHN